MSGRSILDSFWISGANVCFGLVATRNMASETKLYAGVGSGFDRDVDQDIIADHGGKVNPRMLAEFLEKNIPDIRDRRLSLLNVVDAARDGLEAGEYKTDGRVTLSAEAVMNLTTALGAMI